MLIHDASTIRASETSAIFGDDRAAAALTYAALGLPVFPIHSATGVGACSCGIPACRNTGKHPRIPNGLHGSTRDTDQIAAWWRTWSDANIGVVTGAISDLWVLDIDPDAEGLENLERLEDQHALVPPTWCVETGGDGLHLWFRLGGATIRNSVSRIGPGLDVRGERGYVIVPPSNHCSGQSYRWAEGWHPTQFDLIPAPTWLETLALQASQKMIPPDRPPIGTQVGGNHFASPTIDIPQGSRNATLTRLAGAMRRHGAGEKAIEAALRIENTARCKPPLTDDEIATIARSVVRYAPENPPRLVRPGQRGKSFVQFIDGRAVAG